MTDKNKTRFRVMVIAISVIFIAALSGGYFFWKSLKQKQMMFAMQSRIMEVNVIAVKTEKLQLFQELPARVTAYKISEVRPQIDGVIKKQIFEEGGFVKQGQALYQIDPNLYQIAYDDAKANLKAIEAKKKRYDNLIESEAISKQEYDDISASFEQAKAAIKKAKTNISYAKIPAPISGYIGKSNVTVGTLVTANQSTVLTTITQLDPIYVDIVQPTKEMLKLGDQKEIPVSLMIDDLAYENLGSLKFSEVFADESTDSVRLRAKFSNEDKKLIPGMFVLAKLHLKPIEAIAVPQKATSRMPDGSLMVFVIAEKTENSSPQIAEKKIETPKNRGFVTAFQNLAKTISEKISGLFSGDFLSQKKQPESTPQNSVLVAKPRIIKAEQAIGDRWIVTEGLNDGDVVIVEGLLKISDGAKVKPVFPIENAAKEENKS